MKHIQMMLGLGIACVLVLGGFGLAPVAAQGPVTPYGFRFPEEVGGLRRLDFRDFESMKPGMGYGASYRGEGWIVSVYIYKAGHVQIPDGVDSPAVKAQLDAAQRDIRSVRAYSSTELVKHLDIAGDGGMKVRCAMYRIVREGRQSDSFACLTGWSNSFIKLRLTASPGAAATEAWASGHVRRWMEVLRPAA